MDINHTAKLTSSELAMLWNTYLGDSMASCILTHFLSTFEDPDIAPILNQAIAYSKQHVAQIKSLFNKEKIPVPQGFTITDQNQEAPRIFADEFYLRYLRMMGRSGMTTYSLGTGTSIREDVLQLFKEWLQQSSSLYATTTNLMVHKGIIVRAPTLAYPTEVEFVEKQNFLAGFFGDQRPLIAMEIAHLGTNIEINQNVLILLLGFTQVAKSKKVRQYFEMGHEIATKHKNLFVTILETNNSPTPSTWGSTVSASTTSPFSDKLIMFQTGVLSALMIGDYGAAMGASMRRDLGTHYARLMLEIMQYAEDGANIMIDNGWMEKPPQTIDRKKLTRV